MRKLLVTLFCIAFLSPLTHGNAQQSGSIQVYVFYIDECQACGGILKGYLPTLKSTYPSLEINTFNIGNPSYYEAMVELETQLGRTGNELPVLIIGNQILSGEQEITEKLAPLLLEYQLRGGTLLPPLEIPTFAYPSEKTFSVDLVYFYQRGCSKCDRAIYLLKYFSKRYPNLNVREIDINSPDGKLLNETLSDRLNLPVEKRLLAPTIFIGNDYLLPHDMAESKIEVLIRKYEKVATTSALTMGKGEMKKAEESMVERFKSLGVLTVLSAGLIDGINPCAFATLIFFISYLTLVGRKRKEILWVGIGFSGAVFATYLLIGLGILSFVRHLSFLPVVSRVVYLVTIAIALILGAVSLYDYVQLKRSRASEMKLQLPDFLKRRIHQTIRRESRSARYLLAALVSGFIISLLEFTCTGQVYLPTILFVMNIPSLRGSAVSYLVFYNLMFIIPLLTIFGLVYWGVTSEQLAFFLRKKASTIRLLTSLLFLALAGVLVMNFI